MPLGPPTVGALGEVPVSMLGASVAVATKTIPSESLGPPLVQEAATPIPASSVGPVSDQLISADPNLSFGPVFDHDTRSIPTSSFGPVTDEAVNHDPNDSFGPVFDHDTQAFPDSVVGPVSDLFVGIPAPITCGPVFDHDAAALLGIPTHGPVSDAYLQPALSYHGPVFDHVVKSQPPLIPTLDPDSVSPDPGPRNRIRPDPVDILSPNVYGFEKDENGKTVGNKY